MDRGLRILLSLAIFAAVGVFVFFPSSPATQVTSQRSPGRGPGGIPDAAPAGAEDGITLTVGQPVTPTLTGDLGDLPLSEIEFFLDREINPRLNLKEDVFQSGQRGLPGGVDSLLDLQANAPEATDEGFLIPILNFNAQDYTSVNPPDTVGDVGPSHYVHMVNSGGGADVVIYDKNGVVLTGPSRLDSLGSGSCASGYGDPIVLYDHLADRWLLSEFASSGNHLCIYVSQTSDPTGSYYAYDFSTPNFPDYPKYAVWPDAYYVSSNENSPAVYALDRNRMLQGLSATSQRFTGPDLAGFGFQAYTPSDLDGAMSPPAGAPNYFMRHRDDEVHNVSANPSQDYLEIWEFHVDWDNANNSTFTGPLNVPVSEFDSDLCGLTSFYCFPQQGSSTTLDPLREVVMWRLQYRNFGDYQALVGNLVTDVDGTDHGGIRWFELRKTTGNWTLYQEGTYAPDAASRWMGSIAMDGSGNIALGYSVSSSSMYPSMRYAGRLAGDPVGTLPQEEGTIVDGTSANGSNRWGDYSAMSVDPADDCTFWHTNMFSENGHWNTQVTTFKFDSCGVPDFTVEVTPQLQSVCQPEDAQYQVQVGSIGGFSDAVTLSTSGNPGTAAFDNNPLTPPDSSTLTVNGAGPGSYTFDVIGTAGAVLHSETVQLQVAGSTPGIATLLSPPDGATGVAVQPTLTWSAVADAGDYTVEIATDAGFANVVDSATVADTAYTPANGLAPGALHYWRVIANNACGGTASTSFSFTTESVVCTVVTSTDVPKTISSFGTSSVSSVLTVAEGLAVTDLDVQGLQGQHTRFGDLDFRLTSPAGTTVQIMEQSCGNEDDFDLNLDDEAPPGPWPCPPADGGTYQPSHPLAAFDGQDPVGTWTLTVDDNSFFNGGSLQGWGLQICATACVLPDAVTGVAISAVSSNTLQVAWDDMGADHYEVWYAVDDPYFDPSGLDCDSPGPYQCQETSGTSTQVDHLGDANANHTYVIRAVNACGDVSSALSQRVGEFDYLVTPAN